jgi:hypothetical protein
MCLTVNTLIIAEHQPNMPTAPVSLPSSVDRVARPLNGPIAVRRREFHTMSGLLEDAMWLMLVVLLVPVVILLIGAPIALCIRAIVEIVRLFS